MHERERCQESNSERATERRKGGEEGELRSVDAGSGCCKSSGQ